MATPKKKQLSRGILMDRRVEYLGPNDCPLAEDVAALITNSGASSQGSAYGRVLRLALAAKGGVSLAVWIGGAVAEIDVLRRVRLIRTGSGVHRFYVLEEPGETVDPHVRSRAQTYAAWLDKQRYDRVEVDILAGASAGGLNSVLYAVSQRVGGSFDQVLSVWQQQGAIWALLQPNGLHAVPSVFRGDGYFWSGVESAINTIRFGPRNRLHESDKLSVHLSATISDPDYLAQNSGRGHFRFVLPPSKIEDGDGCLRKNNLVKKLAYAARATSSFPGAFEPALIWSHALEEEYQDNDPFEDGPVDMSVEFAARRGNLPGIPFRVIDGGILDNVPIDRALHAVRTSPTDTYDTRRLLYLDPSPDARIIPPAAVSVDPPSWANREVIRKDRLSRFTQVLLAAQSIRRFRESAEDEIEQVAKDRLRALAQEARLRAWKQASMITSASSANRKGLQDAYIVARAVTDLALLREAMEDPERWLLDTESLDRPSLQPTSQNAKRTLERDLKSGYQSMLASVNSRERPSVLQGPQALLETVWAALAWLRAQEEQAFGKTEMTRLDPPGRQESIRENLYKLQAQARHLRDTCVLGVLKDTESSTAKERWLREQDARLERCTPIWAELDDVVECLRELSTKNSTPVNPWAAFPQNWRSWDLTPFVALAFRSEGHEAVGFTAITASEPTALDSGIDLAELLAARRARQAEKYLRIALDEDFGEAVLNQGLPEQLDADSKLAGSSLFNFAAFFSERWRTNDWWWGRVDASAGIVRMLADLDPPPLATDDPDSLAGAPDTDARKVQSEVVAQVKQLQPRGTSGPEGDPILLSGPGDLFRLQPAYVAAILHRLSRLLLRSFDIGDSWPMKICEALVKVIAPLFLVLLPFSLVHLPAIFSASVIAVAISLSSTSGSPSVYASIFIIILAVLCLIPLLSTRKASLRRKRLINCESKNSSSGPIDSIKERLYCDLAARMARGEKWSRWYFWGALLTGVASVAVGFHDGWSARTLIFLIVTFSLSVTSWWNLVCLPSEVANQTAATAWTVACIMSGLLAVGLIFLTNQQRQTALLPIWLTGPFATVVITAVLSLWLVSAYKERPRKAWIQWFLLSLGSGLVTCGVAFGLKTAGVGTIWTSLILYAVAAHYLWWAGSIPGLGNYGAVEVNDIPDSRKPDHG
ncbi:DUF3376 domain-containing protein [Arthrobacter sp. AG367]|uniref:DUF3376 domain-containing protein n=1 Tax=Arthrobacter sp. AG367 TaxID=2572909 RepID=UPI00164919FC|nr:DUF3376 domain-containing protein [Arthrobacter sp. AG367]